MIARILFYAVLSLCLFSATSARAQFDVQCRLENTRILQFEPAVASVVIVNNTGRDLDMRAKDKDMKLVFDIEQTPGTLILPKCEVLADEPFAIKAGQKIEEKVDLSGCYPLYKTGPYSVQARVEWSGHSFISPKASLEVVPGLEIGRMLGSSPANPVEVRLCSLRTLNRNREDRVFVRIEDEKQSACYGVVELGRIIRLFPPTLRIDKDGNLNILHQSGPQHYTHTVVSLAGVPISQEVYSAAVSLVSMEVSDDGRVSVKGLNKMTGNTDEFLGKAWKGRPTSLK